MRTIIQANIDRFQELLKTEIDPTKRAMEIRLLAEEEAKLKNTPATDQGNCGAPYGAAIIELRYFARGWGERDEGRNPLWRELPQCGERVIAPDQSEYLSAERIRHMWSCSTCSHAFETLVTFAEQTAGA